MMQNVLNRPWYPHTINRISGTSYDLSTMRKYTQIHKAATSSYSPSGRILFNSQVPRFKCCAFCTTYLILFPVVPLYEREKLRRRNWTHFLYLFLSGFFPSREKVKERNETQIKINLGTRFVTPFACESLNNFMTFYSPRRGPCELHLLMIYN